MYELLIKFLERNFTIVFDGRVWVLEVSSGEKLSYENLIKIITKIFCLTYNDEDLKKNIDKWTKDKSTEFVGGLSDFLENCVIELGPTNWEVKHKLYGKINIDEIYLYPIDSPMKNYHEAITHYVGEWYDEEVIKASEKMMGFNDNIW